MNNIKKSEKRQIIFKPMKNILIILIALVTFNVNAQNTESILFKKTKTEQIFAMNTVKSPIKTESIDLKLSVPQRYREPNEMRTTGLAIFLGGIAFTTAAILESGDFKIYQGETARQIMLGVGIGLTITGGVISIKN